MLNSIEGDGFAFDLVICMKCPPKRSPRQVQRVQTKRRHRTFGKLYCDKKAPTTNAGSRVPDDAHNGAPALNNLMKDVGVSQRGSPHPSPHRKPGANLLQRITLRTLLRSLHYLSLLRPMRMSSALAEVIAGTI